MTEYFTVKVPRTLTDKIIERVIKHDSYRNVSEFIMDSIRRRLDQLQTVNVTTL
jgi:Arc/MetJ-type ribon-helix-helix transcriptional regulator